MELRASGKSLYAPLSSARDDPETRAGHDGVRVVQHHQEQTDRYHCAIFREEYYMPSVEATMASKAVRSRTKYQSSPG